jgi:hypothetical protein
MKKNLLTILFILSIFHTFVEMNAEDSKIANKIKYKNTGRLVLRFAAE